MEFCRLFWSKRLPLVNWAGLGQSLVFLRFVVFPSVGKKEKTSFVRALARYQFNCVFLLTDRNVGKKRITKIGAGHETLCNYPHATRFPQIRPFVVQESSQVKKETKKEKMGEQVWAFWLNRPTGFRVSCYVFKSWSTRTSFNCHLSPGSEISSSKQLQLLPFGS